MKRRALLGGLAGILASGFAPAFVGSSILMPVRRILIPPIMDPVDLSAAKMEAIVRMTRELIDASAPLVPPDGYWLVHPDTGARLSRLEMGW